MALDQGLKVERPWLNHVHEDMHPRPLQRQHLLLSSSKPRVYSTKIKNIMKPIQARMFFLTWIITLACCPSQATATVLCERCRPREMKDAPGVGIDLTMAYGTAAIHYKNGTTRDLGKFDGNPEYLLAMKTFAEDAQNVQGSMKSSMKRLDSSQPVIQPINSYWRWPYFGIFASKLRPSEDQSELMDTGRLDDDSVKAIAAMLSDIKRGAMDVLDPPLKYNHVLLSWPDVEYKFAHTDRIHLASSLAGLDDFHGHGTIASRFALSQERVSKACYDPEKDMEDTLCDPSLPNLPTLLVITYNAASLGVTLNTRLWGDIPWPERLMESPTLGASFANATTHGKPTEYWIKVKESIASVIGNTTIDSLLLLGSHARDPNLLGVIKDVIDRCGNTDPSILDRYTAYPSSPDDEASALFAAARGAAVNARVGMETDFQACVEPSWCDTQPEL